MKKETKTMSKQEAQAFRDRWRAVNAAEREELRQTSAERKFHQLASLMESVKGLDWYEALSEREGELRERWNRLRRQYHV